MNGSMPGTSKGFTLIELAIAIVIIGIIMTIAVPMLFQRSAPAWKKFATEMNAFLQVGSLDAMSDGKLRRIRFDFERDRVSLEVAKKSNAQATDVNTEFVIAQSPQLNTVIPWPERLQMRHFFIGKDDEMTGSGSTKRVWFFIGPDGRVQDVTLIIFDADQERVMSLITNPFNSQLTVHDGAKKPE